MEIIETKNLSKKFGNFTAVDSINLSVKKGEVFGLLGPNGAGKTTTISMLSTILEPNTGSAKVNGFDILSERDSVRKSIGIVFQDPSLDTELTGRENLVFHARLYGLDKGHSQKRIQSLLKLVGLEEKANVLVSKYSGGMKRRLEIARGLIHAPKVLFLDEPTLGLDPQTRRKIWRYIKQLNKRENSTVILTTHYLEEADFLCDRIAIIDSGKIVALETPKNLKGMLGGDVIQLKTNSPKKLRAKLSKEKYLIKSRVFDGSLRLTVCNGEKVLPEIIALASKNKIKIKSVSLKKPSLEDVFIYFTGKSIREESAENPLKLDMKMEGR